MSDEQQQVMQRKYVELQVIDQQLRQLHQQVQMLDQQASEIDSMQLSLEEMNRTGKGADIFATIAPGISVKAKLENSEHVLMNVGAGVVVKKKVSAAKEVLSKQATDLRSAIDEVQEQMKTFMARAEELQKELQGIVENV